MPAANYSYTFVPAAGTINQRAITVTAASDTKTYDGTTARRAYRRSRPAAWRQVIPRPTSRRVFDSRNAGPQTLTPSGIVNDGNGGANYSYTFAAAAGTINQRAITVTAVDATPRHTTAQQAPAAVPIVTGGLGAGDTPAFTRYSTALASGSGRSRRAGS